MSSDLARRLSLLNVDDIASATISVPDPQLSEANAKAALESRIKHVARYEKKIEERRKKRDGDTPPPSTTCVKNGMGKRQTSQKDAFNHVVTDINTLLRTIYDVIIDEEENGIPDLLRVVRFGPKDKGFMIVDAERFDKEIHSVSSHDGLLVNLRQNKGFKLTVFENNEMLWQDEASVFARGRRNDLHLIKAPQKPVSGGRKQNIPARLHDLLDSVPWLSDNVPGSYFGWLTEEGEFAIRDVALFQKDIWMRKWGRTGKFEDFQQALRDWEFKFTDDKTSRVRMKKTSITYHHPSGHFRPGASEAVSNLKNKRRQIKDESRPTGVPKKIPWRKKELIRLGVPRLRALANDHGISAEGKKDDLVDRLYKAANKDRTIGGGQQSAGQSASSSSQLESQKLLDLESDSESGTEGEKVSRSTSTSTRSKRQKVGE